MKKTPRKCGNSVGVRKPKKSFNDIAKPLISTKGWKFDREEANKRR